MDESMQERLEWEVASMDEIRAMLITEDEKKELANPNSKEEWVQKHQAREKELLDAGITQETLDSLKQYYRSRVESGEFVVKIRKKPDRKPAAEESNCNDNGNANAKPAAKLRST